MKGRDGRIDDFVAELAASLRGHRRQVHDVVAEVRGGLEDSMEAYCATGMTRAAAERVAVEEFGSVELLVPALQDALAVGAGRRAAWAAVGVLAVQPVVWSAPVTNVVSIGSHQSTSEWLLQPMAVIGSLAMVVLSAGWLVLQWSSAMAGRGRRFTRVLAVATGLSVTSIGALGLARSMVGPAEAASGPRLLWATVGLFAPLAWVGRAAWSAWWAAPFRKVSDSG